MRKELKEWGSRPCGNLEISRQRDSIGRSSDAGRTWRVQRRAMKTGWLENRMKWRSEGGRSERWQVTVDRGVCRARKQVLRVRDFTVRDVEGYEGISAMECPWLLFLHCLFLFSSICIPFRHLLGSLILSSLSQPLFSKVFFLSLCALSEKFLIIIFVLIPSLSHPEFISFIHYLKIIIIYVYLFCFNFLCFYYNL